jgi:hypothetical protein
VLVQPETFPQQPSRPASFHCIANLAAGHHSQPCRRIFGEQKPVHNQTTADRPFSFRFGLKKIASQFQPAGMGETKRARRLDAHAKLNRRQTLASDAAAIGQSGFAALGGVTIQKTVLPFAANFRWLILAFHVSSLNCVAQQWAGSTNRSRVLAHCHNFRNGSGEHNNEETPVNR